MHKKWKEMYENAGGLGRCCCLRQTSAKHLWSTSLQSFQSSAPQTHTKHTSFFITVFSPRGLRKTCYGLEQSILRNCLRSIRILNRFRCELFVSPLSPKSFTIYINWAYFEFQETTLNVLVLELPSTLPPSWSTWPPRFWSWLVMPPGTTRKPVSFPDIFNLPSVTTKSSTNFWPASPLHKEVSCPTSKLSCCPRRLNLRPPKLNYL